MNSDHLTDASRSLRRRGFTTRIAQALGCSEGQAYTAVLSLGLAVAVVLFGIPGRTIVSADTAAPAPTSTTTTVPSPTTTGSFGSPPDVMPVTSTTTTPPTGSDPGTTPPTLAGDPCKGDQLAEAGKSIAEQINTGTGGTVTAETVVLALRVAAGCDDSDPVAVILSLLTEVGRTLPDPGIPGLHVPPIEIPPILAPLAGPLVAPVCAQATTFVPLLILLSPSYPEPFQSLMVTAALQTYGVCGALGG